MNDQKNEDFGQSFNFFLRGQSVTLLSIREARAPRRTQPRLRTPRTTDRASGPGKSIGFGRFRFRSVAWAHTLPVESPEFRTFRTAAESTKPWSMLTQTSMRIETCNNKGSFTVPRGVIWTRSTPSLNTLFNTQFRVCAFIFFYFLFFIIFYFLLLPSIIL
jgi:hypothetical protein